MSSLSPWLILAAIACAVLGIFGLAHWWMDTRSGLRRRALARIEESLQRVEDTETLITGAARGQSLSVPPPSRLPIRRVLRYLEEAGLGPRLKWWASIALLWWAATAVAVSIWLGTGLLGSIVFAIFSLVPVAVVIHQHDQVAQALERQIPEALDVMARTLQAGKALPFCWKEMGDVLEKPIAPICRDIYLKLQYGGDLESVLRDTAQRIPSEDLRFFFVALIIQTRSGGNLVTLLRDQSQLIRERIAIREKIRALSAEGRLSGWLMGLMPFFVTAMMLLINPETMSLLWTTSTGLALIQAGLLLQLLGTLWIVSLTRIRV